MSNIQSLKGFQRAREKRSSVEEKAKILEENARVAKLSIDKQLFVQILQEENRTHDAAIKELKEKLQEENRAHDDAIKELEEKIADLEQQVKPSSKVRSIPSEMPPEPAQEVSEPSQEMSEPAQEVSEPPQKISTEVDEGVRIGMLQERVRTLLQESKRTESERSESEAPLEAPKKKKRGLF